jgi:hypothetical protein
MAVLLKKGSMEPILQNDALYPYYKPRTKEFKYYILLRSSDLNVETNWIVKAFKYLVYHTYIIFYVKLNICICLKHKTSQSQLMAVGGNSVGLGTSADIVLLRFKI